ncbi:MAG: acetylglutamate kinase [Holophagales bacterium]|nr:acetylglutamate kinase [Holophagales bacterium]
MTDVVKLGGSLLENRDLRHAALEAVATAWSSGKRSIVVHGGGKRIDAMLAALDIPKKVQGGLRVTDAETLDVVVSILSGLVNKTLVAELRGRGIRAAGLSGADGDTLWAEFHEAIEGVDLGFVGRVVRCDPTLLAAVLGAGFLPLVASVALGREGTLLNVNADSAASALAGALGAKRLVFLTDVEGVKGADGAVIDRIDARAARTLLASPAVTGGMKPKLRAAVEALEAGVSEVVIAGPSMHRAALLEGKGGTHLVAA